MIGPPRHSRSATIVSAWILLTVATACSDDERATSGAPGLLPAQIHGLSLVQSHSGDPASGIIARLHREGVAPAESEIGVYGSEDLRAELYVSVFQTAAQATEQFEAMAAAMNESPRGFGHHSHFDAAGRDVHVVFGDGRINYFYVEGDRLTWLGVSPMIARAAIAELLATEADSIPKLPGMGKTRAEAERS